MYRRNGFEKLRGFLDRHFEHVGYVFALVLDFERFPVVSFAPAHLARHVNVGKEMHCYLYYSVALTVFASSARDVERKPSALVSPFLRVGSSREKVAYHCEHARIGRGIAPRRSAYGLLVDGDNFIEVFKPFEAFGIARKLARSVEIVCKIRINYFVDKAGFSASRYPRNRSQKPDGNLYGHVFKVVLLTAVDFQVSAVGRNALFGDFDTAPAREIIAGNRTRFVHNILYFTAGDHFTAVNARAGSDVDDIVRRTHCILVVFDDYERIAQIP